jgi:hypothetical protein
MPNLAVSILGGAGANEVPGAGNTRIDASGVTATGGHTGWVRVRVLGAGVNPNGGDTYDGNLQFVGQRVGNQLRIVGINTQTPEGRTAQVGLNSQVTPTLVQLDGDNIANDEATRQTLAGLVRQMYVQRAQGANPIILAPTVRSGILAVPGSGEVTILGDAGFGDAPNSDSAVRSGQTLTVNRGRTSWIRLRAEDSQRTQVGHVYLQGTIENRPNGVRQYRVSHVVLHDQNGVAHPTTVPDANFPILRINEHNEIGFSDRQTRIRLQDTIRAGFERARNTRHLHPGIHMVAMETSGTGAPLGISGGVNVAEAPTVSQASPALQPGASLGAPPNPMLETGIRLIAASPTGDTSLLDDTNLNPGGPRRGGRTSGPIV